MLLSVVEDLPLEEIALITGVPLGTAKSRISRAKDRLYAILKPYDLKSEGSESGPQRGNGNRPKRRKFLSPIEIQKIIGAHAEHGYASRAAKYMQHSTSTILAIWKLNKLPIYKTGKPKSKEKM